jgi:uncharacterized protein YfdQ (DUF2303 family)
MTNDELEIEVNLRNQAVRDIANLAEAGSDQRDTRNHGSYVVVPEGYKIVNLDHRLDAPRRVRRTVHVRDLPSYLALIERFKKAESCVYWEENGDGLKARAVFDDVDKDVNAWGEHCAVLTTTFSPEFRIWQKSSKTTFTQLDFARFVEDNLPDFRSPDGATMLELARKFEAHKKVHFASDLRLQNGDIQLTYQEETEAKAKGQISFPSEFTVGITILSNGDPYEVKCNLRYKLSEGKLAIWYEIVREHKLIESACNDVLEVIRAKGLPVWQGKVVDHYPEASCE